MSPPISGKTSLMDEFSFAFDSRAAALLKLAAIRADTAWATVRSGRLSVHFGHFRLSTPLDNILDAEVTGPYRWWKAIGVRLSLADRGITFGTNARAGVCVRFRTPVESVGRRFGLRHPGMTVTVADPAAFAAALTHRS